ncbi:flagellar motor switch protein FliG, partial [bacterium]|nr:flagellar motor switch protein FliG [bacterium]
NLDDHYIQEILKEVKGKELATALKGTPANIKDKIFKNMSKRARAGIEEDMEYMGPVPLQEVEESQMKIVSVVRRLMDEGVIVLGRGGGGAALVT